MCFAALFDLIKIIFWALSLAYLLSGNLNITSGNAKSLKEFVNIIEKYTGKIKYKITKRDSFRPKRGTLSIDKAKKLLKYKPDYNLYKGIGECIHFVKTKKIK